MFSGDSRSLARTPNEGTLKNSKFKRSAPPPPSPLGHQRSPSDTLIGKYGGRLVLPQGEPPQLRKTSIPNSPSISTTSFTHIQHSTPVTNPYSILNSSLNMGGSAVTPTSLPSPIINSSSSTVIPNGTKTYPIDLSSMRVISLFISYSHYSFF